MTEEVVARQQLLLKDDLSDFFFLSSDLIYLHQFFLLCVEISVVHCQPGPQVVPLELSLPQFFCQLVLFLLAFSLIRRELVPEILNRVLLAANNSLL